MLRLINRSFGVLRTAPALVRSLATGTYHVTINGRKYDVADGHKKTVLQACQEVGVYVPYLCYHPVLGSEGHCRLCVVEIDNHHVPLTPSCVTPLHDGMNIHTDTKKVKDIVKTNLELLRARHPNECQTCTVNGKCEFQDLIYKYKIEERFPNVHRGNMVNHAHGEGVRPAMDLSSPSIVRDMAKCVLCGRCVRACNDFQGMGVLGYEARGGEKMVSTPYNLPLNDTDCVNCGQCAARCPVGAIVEKDSVHAVDELLNKAKENGYTVVAQTAPAVRVAIGEEFNMDSGSISTGRMVASLKKLGFDYVFDTNFSADLTIIEEGTELISRIKNGGPFPMFTSCCPAWINLVEKVYPEYTKNLSTCKSPQGMLGSVIKTVFSERINVDPLKVKVVSIMPCTAKKDECTREALSTTFANQDGVEVKVQDVDYVLTTRELATLIKMNRIPFASLPDMEFDSPLGDSTGAAVIFGASGGVQEAALRTVYEIVTGKKLDSVEFKELRGYAGIREATIDLGALKVNVAVASGLKHAHEVMRLIKEGKKQYHFVEIMACPGGCINGGGQPKINSLNAVECRNASTYKIDEKSEHRKSHENPSVADIYTKYFGSANSSRAHHLLHTHYTNRKAGAAPVADNGHKHH